MLGRWEGEKEAEKDVRVCELPGGGKEEIVDRRIQGQMSCPLQVLEGPTLVFSIIRN